MKNNKEELKKQAAKLQKDLDDLKKLIAKEETIDLFSVTSYKELCKLTKEKELTNSDFEDERILAFAQLKQIERLYNQGWIKDWKNQNQYKYYPYFTVNSSGGLVFNCSIYYYYDYCYGAVGFFKDKETSDFVGRTFIKIYEKLK